jgi:hypothetical protein
MATQSATSPAAAFRLGVLIALGILVMFLGPAYSLGLIGPTWPAYFACLGFMVLLFAYPAAQPRAIAVGSALLTIGIVVEFAAMLLKPHSG